MIFSLRDGDADRSSARPGRDLDMTRNSSSPPPVHECDDPAYPAARLAYMLEDSGAALVQTRDHLDVRWLEGAVPAVSIDAVLGAEATPEAQPAGGVIEYV